MMRKVRLLGRATVLSLAVILAGAGTAVASTGSDVAAGPFVIGGHCVLQGTVSLDSTSIGLGGGRGTYHESGPGLCTVATATGVNITGLTTLISAGNFVAGPECSTVNLQGALTFTVGGSTYTLKYTVATNAGAGTIFVSDAGLTILGAGGATLTPIPDLGCVTVPATGFTVGADFSFAAAATAA